MILITINLSVLKTLELWWATCLCKETSPSRKLRSILQEVRWVDVNTIKRVCIKTMRVRIWTIKIELVIKLKSLNFWTRYLIIKVFSKIGPVFLERRWCRMSNTSTSIKISRLRCSTLWWVFSMRNYLAQGIITDSEINLEKKMLSISLKLHRMRHQSGR